jgi:hypothetical protein
MPDEGEAVPLAERLEALIRQGEAVFNSEVAYQKARVSFGWSRGKRVAIFLALAGAFGGLTLIAMVVGLLIALAPLLTPWGALAVVFFGLTLLSGLCFRAAVRAFRDARDTVLGKPIPAETAVVAKVEQENEA